jgi:cell division protease FtsH
LKYFKGYGFYIVLIVATLIIIMQLYNNTGPNVESYSELLTQIRANNLKNMELKGTEATVELKSDIIIEGEPVNVFVVNIPDIQKLLDQVEDPIKEQEIEEFLYSPPSSPGWWVNILPMTGLVLIFVLLWVFFIQQSQGGSGSRVMTFGKSRAKLATDDKKKSNILRCSRGR